MTEIMEYSNQLAPEQRQPETSTLEERHPDWPLVDVLFYFAPHGNVTDMEGIAPYLKKADICFYEDSGNPDGTVSNLQEVMNDLSRDPQVPIEAVEKFALNGRPLRDSKLWPIIKGTYGTGKIIDSIDLVNDSSTDELKVRLAEVTDYEISKNATFDEALEKMSVRLMTEAELHKEREAIMADMFEDKIQEILEQNPKLKDKPRLTILISMGPYHTQLRHTFTEKGISSDQKFSTRPYVFSYGIELTRTYAFAREPSRELLERAYVEDLLLEVVKVDPENPAVSSDAFIMSMRLLTSQLSEEQMRELHEMHKRDKLTTKNVDRFLESNGLDPLPQTPGNGRMRRFGTNILSLFRQ
jgi:hypothetical protein